MKSVGMLELYAFWAFHRSLWACLIIPSLGERSSVRLLLFTWSSCSNCLSLCEVLFELVCDLWQKTESIVRAWTGCFRLEMMKLDFSGLEPASPFSGVGSELVDGLSCAPSFEIPNTTNVSSRGLVWFIPNALAGELLDWNEFGGGCGFLLSVWWLSERSYTDGKAG